MERCGWVGTDTIYLKYHDHEWGVPEYDSQALWEKLVLDGFQAGLSWITILKKRDEFRTAFVNFDPHIIATWGPLEVEVCYKTLGLCVTVVKLRLRLVMRKPICGFQVRCHFLSAYGLM